MSDEWVVNSVHTKEVFLEYLAREYEENKYLIIKVEAGSIRTKLQNNSLHLYFSMLARELNDGGFDMRKALKPGVEIPWTTAAVKKYMWKPIQKALINKTKTSKADRKEYTIVYETLNRHTAEKFGVSIPWPSKD